MNQKLESSQEGVLEDLMQRSFGAQNMFIPKNYKRGLKKNREKEPCDLVWYGNGVLVLFYLTSGSQPIHKQDEHNLKQAAKWINYWRRQSKEHLIATNRYNNELSITFKELKYCICISVISHVTGIVFHKINVNKPIGYTCTIPESLIHSISGFHGTVIDLLEIIHEYSFNLPRHILRHGPVSDERLATIVGKRIKTTEALLNYESNTKYGDDSFSLIYKFINEYRLPDPVGNALSSSSDRQLIANYFSDMPARDFIILAIAAEQVIKKSENGRFSLAAETTGMHLNWIVCVTNIASRNMGEFLESFLDEIKEKNLPILIYGYFIEGAEHRSPFMQVLQEQKSIQSQHLVKSTVQRLLNVFKR
ncbi:hypothetical protein [Methylomonas sp. UP202]|uniref:hypothetical protein n=1 Tax=Methylomonas sp. UP202 TaxID=3040943 RepID=UPI00247A72A3|nr:hypothetical protein [Methylomonas sp. UP202]WGS88119.1 hypothetical protein QC632_10250 [Methylomonas sp. UP202]